MSAECKNITIDDVVVEVIQKNIRNIHLRIRPPLAKVTVSAPFKMDLEKIRSFCVSKLAWIQKQQKKIKSLKFELPSEFVSGENHYYLGQKYTLAVIEGRTRRKVLINSSTLELYVPEGAGKKTKKDILEKWYKGRLKETVLPHIEKLERIMNVSVAKLVIRSMKTRWGTCHPTAKKICLNTELAKQPFAYIEYVLIHEMAHLLESGHQKRFKELMDKFSPNWRNLRRELKKHQLNS